MNKNFSGASSSTTTSNQFFYAEEANRLLTNNEISTELENNQNVALFPSVQQHQNNNFQNIVKRVDTNIYAANDQVEDRFSLLHDPEEFFFSGTFFFTLSKKIY